MTDDQAGSAGPRTVTQLLLARADDPGVALRCDDDLLTWRELVAQARARAAMLLALRQPGPFHVGVLLENTPEYVCWIYAAALARATVVGINPTRRGDSLSRDVRHTDCQLLVTDAQGAALLAGLDVGVGADRVLLVDAADYAGLVASYSGADVPAETAQPSDRLLLMFTSGSTGAPKAVICTNGRLGVTAVNAAAHIGLRADDVFYESMPLFHGNAVMANLAPALALGATVALRPRFSASHFLTDVRRYGATYFNYVGRALAYILATPESPDDADNPLRVGFGTEASSRDQREFSRRFGCRLIESYGSSEGVIATHAPEGTPPNSIGLPQPRPGSDVAVVDPATGRECATAVFDPNGRLVNADEAIGEIVDRGGAPSFEGYYRNEAATAERMRDGWYWTGDLAYRDGNGFLYFAGRSPDWLRVDSENFAAAPVETVLARHPDVVMVAVFPVPDARTGDQVMAALELRKEAIFDPAEFAAFLESQTDLGTKWAPRFVRLVAAMPLTGTNKVDKAPLRGSRWETTDPVWWRPGKDLRYVPFTAAHATALRTEFAANGRSDLLG